MQQSTFYQLCVIPALTLVGSTAWECAHHDITSVSVACIVAGAKAAAPFVIIYVWALMQHSPGSASFNADGTVNQLIASTRK